MYRDLQPVPFGEIGHLRSLLEACRRMLPYLDDDSQSSMRTQLEETRRLVEERLSRLGALPRDA